MGRDQYRSISREWDQLRLEHHGGAPLLQTVDQLQSDWTDSACTRVQSHGRMFGHRRTRLSRIQPPLAPRPLFLFRLLRGLGAQLQVYEWGRNAAEDVDVRRHWE